MAQRRNEICLEWLESKDKGKTNHVNMKPMIDHLKDIEKGSTLMVKLNSR